MASLGAELNVSPTDDGFAVSGELDAHTATGFHELLNAWLTDRPSLVLDMAEVTFMDSSGIRVLVSTTNRSRESGGDVVIATPSPVVQRLIQVSGLSEHLTVQPS